MDVTGEERIDAPRDAVWAALNDPVILKQCIPGCQSIERKSPTEFSMAIRIKLSILSATFQGEIVLSNVNAPDNYTISAEGKGGIAGFAKGAADVTLEQSGAGTILHYVAKAELGGRLAQLGTRFINASAQKLAARFFADFNNAVMETQNPGT